MEKECSYDYQGTATKVMDLSTDTDITLQNFGGLGLRLRVLTAYPPTIHPRSLSRSCFAISEEVHFLPDFHVFKNPQDVITRIDLKHGLVFDFVLGGIST